MTYNTQHQTTIGATDATFDQTADQNQSTTDQIRDKAGQIANDVRETGQKAMEQVSQNVDLKGQIQQRPWLLIGAAAAAGYVLGNLGNSGSKQDSSHRRSGAMHVQSSSFSPGQNTQASAMQQAKQYESSQREGMVGKLGRKFLSNLSSLEELYHEQLQDLYDAEHQILKALPKMMEAASSPELRRAFELHLQQTRGQIQRIEQIFDQMGVAAQGKACMAMQGLVAEGNELMSMRADPAVMDAGLIAAAQRVEHYEMAGYGCLRTWARQLGHHQAAQLLQQTLDEEEQTDRQLTQIAERTANVRALNS